jgi:hypothetical protein
MRAGIVDDTDTDSMNHSAINSHSSAILSAGRAKGRILQPSCNGNPYTREGDSSLKAARSNSSELIGRLMALDGQ